MPQGVKMEYPLDIPTAYQVRVVCQCGEPWRVVQVWSCDAFGEANRWEPVCMCSGHMEE